jgi:hypothetical protein
MADNSKLVADLKALKQKYFIPTEEVPAVKKPESKKLEVILPKNAMPEEPKEIIVSKERLQDAVIWSEILGKPLSKRRH